LARLDAEEAAARSALADAAAALHDARAKAATVLSDAVEVELADLGLPHCRFRVALEPQEPDASGADRVRFLIAPNPGEPAAPLEQIASGGELSRIMLALEVVLAGHEATPVLVFDEVDAGVGGRLGEVLGRKLWSLARHHQVLCVSHLPQVAAYADRHVLVRKEVARGRTHVIAETLDEDGVVAELAAMLGAGGGAASLAAGARELRVGAIAWKAGGVKARKPRR
ncbi:MAG: DNA repair protein RecN, partial [Candidatus Limnocylindria bacterium]|nr:DNA repair protein RecN [Candidatus Limnocylindria bacterium]